MFLPSFYYYFMRAWILLLFFCKHCLTFDSWMMEIFMGKSTALLLLLLLRNDCSSHLSVDLIKKYLWFISQNVKKVCILKEKKKKVKDWNLTDIPWRQTKNVFLPPGKDHHRIIILRIEVKWDIHGGILSKKSYALFVEKEEKKFIYFLKMIISLKSNKSLIFHLGSSSNSSNGWVKWMKNKYYNLCIYLKNTHGET